LLEVVCGLVLFPCGVIAPLVVAVVWLHTNNKMPSAASAAFLEGAVAVLGVLLLGAGAGGLVWQVRRRRRQAPLAEFLEADSSLVLRIPGRRVDTREITSVLWVRGSVGRVRHSTLIGQVQVETAAGRSLVSSVFNVLPIVTRPPSGARKLAARLGVPLKRKDEDGVVRMELVFPSGRSQVRHNPIAESFCAHAAAPARIDAA
jgi:hypothetical protein